MSQITNEVLTLEEYDRVKLQFISIFNDMISLIKSEGDAEEITDHISEVATSIALHKLVVPVKVEDWTNAIFMRATIRDFHLEMTERFVLEITALGKEGYHRFVNLLSNSLALSKAAKTEQRRSIEPSLTTIEVTAEMARRTLLENPWLINLMLMAMLFKRTELGIAVNKAKPATAK